MKKELIQAVLPAVLLTPMMLSSLPSKMPGFEHAYDHTEQVSSGFQVAAAMGTNFCINTSTFNGTQTYDYQGNPYDADSDSDQTGDC